MLPLGDQVQSATVLHHKNDDNGIQIGHSSTNPYLNTSLYKVEFGVQAHISIHHCTRSNLDIDMSKVMQPISLLRIFMNCLMKKALDSISLTNISDHTAVQHHTIYYKKWTLVYKTNDKKVESMYSMERWFY